MGQATLGLPHAGLCDSGRPYGVALTLPPALRAGWIPEGQAASHAASHDQMARHWPRSPADARDRKGPFGCSLSFPVFSLVGFVRRPRQVFAEGLVGAKRPARRKHRPCQDLRGSDQGRLMMVQVVGVRWGRSGKPS